MRRKGGSQGAAVVAVQKQVFVARRHHQPPPYRHPPATCSAPACAPRRPSLPPATLGSRSLARARSFPYPLPSVRASQVRGTRARRPSPRRTRREPALPRHLLIAAATARAEDAIRTRASGPSPAGGRAPKAGGERPIAAGERRDARYARARTLSACPPTRSAPTVPKFLVCRTMHQSTTLGLYGNPVVGYAPRASLRTSVRVD